MSRFVSFVVAMTICTAASSVFAQGYATRADEKVLGGYRPYTARSYMQQARTHAQALEIYGKSDTAAAPKETVQEHVGQVRHSIEATKKELAKLEPTVKNDKEAQELIAGVRSHLAKVSDSCSMLDTEYAKHHAEGTKVASCCTEMVKELDEAHKLHDALLKHLKIVIPAEKK